MKFTDQLNRAIDISFPPKRIVSLVPSQTELLHYLGLKDEVVGITKFCIHPEEWFQNKIRIGGTKNIDFEKVKNLQPDLIIGNKEENNELQIKELMKIYPVWMSDVKNLFSALDMIIKVGEMVARKEMAIQLSKAISDNFARLEFSILNLPLKKAAYFIWKEPMMVAGDDTFISDMMRRCGLENVFVSSRLTISLSPKERDFRYPKISFEELSPTNPDLILLSSEPFPFKEKHVKEFQSIFPKAKILLVDGEMFSWYGSRLIYSVEYFEKLFGI